MTEFDSVSLYSIANDEMLRLIDVYLAKPAVSSRRRERAV